MVRVPTIRGCWGGGILERWSSFLERRARTEKRPTTEAKAASLKALPFSLPEAAQRVGVELHDDLWSDEFLKDAGCEPDRLVRDELRLMVGSDDGNNVFLSDGRDIFPFRPLDTEHEAFYWNLVTGRVKLGHLPGHDFGLLVRRTWLETYLRNNRKNRLGLRRTSTAIKKCRIWLVDQMNANVAKTKARFFEEAQGLLSIGPRGFNQAWIEAINESRCTQSPARG